MSKKQPEVNPGQQLLFAHPEELEPHVVYGPKGSYVDLEFRSEHLINALLAFGKRNQRLGFDYASNAKPHESDIWARYTRQTPVVQEGAAANVNRFEREGKEEFWKATGYAAMRREGIIPEHLLIPSARKDWRDFSTKLADTHNRQKRYELKKTLNRTAKIAKQAKKGEIGQKAA